MLAAVVRKPKAELGSALDRLMEAGLLFRQGAPPHAIYLFKHVLVQDAAYGTLLREPRRALHARIAETLESQFSEIAENRPELLARHCTEAGLIEKAAHLWGTAGQRSLERSALVEAAEQLGRALDQFATLPTTPELRREQIKLQVSLITPLMQIKGHTAPKTKAAMERARLLIEHAEALGEPPDDPLLLFSVLYGFWVSAHAGFNGSPMCELAAQFLAIAEKGGASVPLMVGRRLMGSSLVLTGDIAEGRAYYDQAIALYDPAAHRSLTTRFGQDLGVSNFVFRSAALWLLGYPEAAQRDNDDAVQIARDIGHATSLILALVYSTYVQFESGNYTAANVSVDELVTLADEKGASYYKVVGGLFRGLLFAVTGGASDAVPTISSNLAAFRAGGTKMLVPLWLPYLSRAYAGIGQLDLAWHSVEEALTMAQATGERWIEAEVHRTAGEVALVEPSPDAVKAEAYFQRALAIARQQQAKSWELRAAMSMARLWRDQGKREEARDLLAPVYGWFTESLSGHFSPDYKVF